MEIRIVNADLYKKQYDYETLKANIYAVSMRDVLKTQKLSADFCIKYIINPDFHLDDLDKTIKIEDVLHFQPHITFEDLVSSQLKANERRNQCKRIDSVEDFESYAERHI